MCDRALGRGRGRPPREGSDVRRLAAARERGRREGHRGQPDPHRSRPHLDPAALPQPRGGDLLRARRLRAVVAGRGRVRGAVGRHDRPPRRPRGAHALRGAGRPGGDRVRYASRTGVRLAAALEAMRFGYVWTEGRVDDPWDIEAQVGELEFAEPGDRPSNVVALEDVELDEDGDRMVAEACGSVASGLKWSQRGPNEDSRFPTATLPRRRRSSCSRATGRSSCGRHHARRCRRGARDASDS